MKKKIKDLTIEEIDKICNNTNCGRCPLLFCEDCHYANVCLNQAHGLYDFLNQEIEVEEDEQ